MKVTVVAGNPKPGSRTLDAAGLVASAVTGADADVTVDVIELGAPGDATGHWPQFSRPGAVAEAILRAIG